MVSADKISSNSRPQPYRESEQATGGVAQRHADTSVADTFSRVPAEPSRKAKKISGRKAAFNTLERQENIQAFRGGIREARTHAMQREYNHMHFQLERASEAAQACGLPMPKTDALLKRWAPDFFRFHMARAEAEARIGQRDAAMDEMWLAYAFARDLGYRWSGARENAIRYAAGIGSFFLFVEAVDAYYQEAERTGDSRRAERFVGIPMINNESELSIRARQIDITWESADQESYLPAAKAYKRASLFDGFDKWRDAAMTARAVGISYPDFVFGENATAVSIALEEAQEAEDARRQKTRPVVTKTTNEAGVNSWSNIRFSFRV